VALSEAEDRDSIAFTTTSGTIREPLGTPGRLVLYLSFREQLLKDVNDGARV